MTFWAVLGTQINKKMQQVSPWEVFSLDSFPVLQIWNHPDVLYEALQKENLASEQDLDLDDITTTGSTRCPTAPNQKSKSLESPDPIGGLSLNQLQEKAHQVITYEWVSRKC